ncbi:MAG TPA: ATP-binding cassette domain-containing protein, partial [Armatimonadota bacterium]|nr:ATP-binding cassette domain-containing protein [Armatimonadota bacterium]
MALLDVRNLKVSFSGRRGAFNAVDGVSFAVPAGKTLALVGESGCGKTMTALGLLRLTPSDSEMRADSIRLRDQELTGLGEKELRDVRGCEIAMIFQEPLNALNPVFTIGEQVAETLRAHEKISRRAAWDRAVEQLR